MKKILILMLTVVAVVLNARADGLCATLQHGETMKAYYGADAFKEAYADAADSDVITLSKGQFNGVEKLQKSLTIYGAYGFSDHASYGTYIEEMKIMANNVHIEGVYFYNLTLGKIKNCMIRRCYCYALYSSSTDGHHKNTIVDQSKLYYIKCADQGENFTIKNSKFESFQISYSYNESLSLYVNNCIISAWDCGIYPYGTYKNNVFCLGILSSMTYTVPKCGEFYDNVFVNFHNSECKAQVVTLYVRGTYPCSGNIGAAYDAVVDPEAASPYVDCIKEEYRSVYGPASGTGFSPYTSIPNITSSTIDQRTDNEGKLNVKITVEAH